jgi:4,5-dihydroxyphthalate decarboxylase
LNQLETSICAKVTSVLRNKPAAVLDAGEIDALVSALVPPSYLKHGPVVRRLFEDSKAVERAYFRKTGIARRTAS